MAGAAGNPPTGRAVPRKPSSNPVWAELEALAIRYKTLPPKPQPPATDPERERLRKAIFGLLAATWVQMVVDDAAGDAAANMPGDGGGGANPGNSPTRLVRRDSALEKVLRAEAAKLARLHCNDDLTLAFGSPTNLAAEAQQGFIESHAQRYAKRQQTLLSGMLADWGDSQAGLYTFISRAAANFLKDMHREFVAYGKGWVAKGRRGQGKLVQGGTPADWVLAPSADEDASDTHDADWLAAQHTQHAQSAEEAEDAASHEQALQALDAAVAQLPADLQLLVQLERSKAEHGLADSEIIRRMGLGSRNTLVARRKRLHAALRGLLGRPAGD